MIIGSQIPKKIQDPITTCKKKVIKINQDQNNWKQSHGLRKIYHDQNNYEGDQVALRKVK